MGILGTLDAPAKPARTDFDTTLDAYDDYLERVGVHDPERRQKLLREFEEREIARLAKNATAP